MEAKNKSKSAAYHLTYGRKARAEIKANPKMLTIVRNGYIMTLIEVQKVDRQGVIDRERIKFSQPSFDNIPNMALKSCEPIKKLQNATI